MMTRAMPQRAGATRVEYHCHTRYSYDCDTSLEAVLHRAHLSGIGCICITDHDTIDGGLALKRISPPEIEVVVGCEFTTEDGSHLIGLGLSDMVVEKRIPQLIQEIKRQGGLVLLPHLFRRGSGIFRNEMRRSDAFVRDVLADTDLVECFNGRDTYENNQRSYRFAKEFELATVAGSDAHAAFDIGSVFVEYADQERVHGISRRRIYFPEQQPTTEHPWKRKAMEFYHRHEATLPAVVAIAYRTMRRRAREDRAHRNSTPTRLQYEFPRPAERLEGRA